MVKAIEQPVFLVGSERSGTTMLSLMLKQHHELAWAGEMEYVTGYLSEDMGPIEMEGYYNWLQMDRGFRSANLKVDLALSYSDLMRSFLEQHRAVQNKPLIGGTVHGSFHLLPVLWPRAKFIYLLRDGRDVTRSCIQMGWAGNFWTGSVRWLDAEKQCETLQARVNSDAYIEVKYEDLLAEPVAELSKICKFIDLEYSPEMMRYDEHSTYSKPDPKLAFQWKHKLSNKELRLCEARIGSQLARRGYESSGLARLKVSLVEDVILKIQDKWARIYFGANRVGWKLVILRALANRLGLKELDKKTRLQIQNITTSNLK